VAGIREQHHPKKRFMIGFEEIASPSDRHKRPDPTFMERAKHKWPKEGKR